MNDETRGSFPHRPDSRWLVAGMVLLGVATAGAWWQLLAVSGREDALAQRIEQQSSIAGERESALAAVDRDHRAVLDNLASEHAAMGKRVDTLLGARRSALLAGEADPDGVMHAQLQAPGGLVLMAADTPPGMELSPGSQIAISLSGDGEELHGYWDKLSEGGQVMVPLEKQMWGDEFGWGKINSLVRLRWVLWLCQMREETHASPCPNCPL